MGRPPLRKKDLDPNVQGMLREAAKAIERAEASEEFAYHQAHLAMLNGAPARLAAEALNVSRATLYRELERRYPKLFKRP